MFGIPLFVIACVHCKFINCKCNHTGGTNRFKQSRKHPNVSQSTANTATSDHCQSRILVSQDSNEDGRYHISGQRHFPEKISSPVAKNPKKENKLATVASINIPKKVFTSMIKIPKLSENESRQSSHSEEPLMQSLLKLLPVKSIQKSILRKRLKDAEPQQVAASGTKKTECLIATLDDEGFYYVQTIPLETGPVDLEVDLMDYIDDDRGYSECCRNDYKMKRGFRHLFSQEKMNNRSYADDGEMEHKRGFFQKFFHPSSPRSSGGEGTNADLERRPLLHDEDGYAIIDRQSAELSFPASSSKGKREMSVPVSPKSVTFEDELPFIAEQRGQSMTPRTTFFQNPTTTRTTTSTVQQNSAILENDALQTSALNSWRGDSQHASSSLSDREHFLPSSSSHGASSTALDEATYDLLRLSSEPASIWYSSSPRLQRSADCIPKSASTTSMNKVIRTRDGEMLKVPNTFSWDSARLDDVGCTSSSIPSSKSTYVVDGDEHRRKTVNIYTNERRKGPPIVRTTVEGKLTMEKVVGADLLSIENCMCSTWTIRDTVTHYKVITTLKDRTLIMEEEEVINSKNDQSYKVSLYEGDRLQTKQSVNLNIPLSENKQNYLSLLSERLLRDMETLEESEQQRSITRIEVEIIENVTNILKTYVIGERNDLLQDQVLDQATVDATDEFTRGSYQYESMSAVKDPASSYVVSDKKYIDVLEKDLKISKQPSDIRLFSEGQHFEEHSELRTRKSVESETTTTSESIVTQHLPLRCEHAFVNCELKRTEDHSLNEVNVAMPNLFSVILSLIHECIIQQSPQLASYGIEQPGKQYITETTIQKIHHFESSESTDRAETAVESWKEPNFLFQKPRMIELIKIPELDIARSDLRRLAESSLISVNTAISSSNQSQMDIEGQSETRRAKSDIYGMKRQGYQFDDDDERIIKNSRQYTEFEFKDVGFKEHQVQEEKVESLTKFARERINELQPTVHEFETCGGFYKGESRLQRIRHIESTESISEEIPLGEPTYVDLVKREARGEFEVMIVISNDQRGSPKCFQESQQSENISLVAQISTDGKKEEVLATFAMINFLQKEFIGHEPCIETINMGIVIQKTVQIDDIMQQSIQNWSDVSTERLKVKCRECSEIQAVIMYSIQSNAKRCAETAHVRTEKHLIRLSCFANAPSQQSVQVFVTLTSTVVLQRETQCILVEPNILRITFGCGIFCREDTTAVIYMQNRFSTTIMPPYDYVRKTPRISSGHVLNTKATREEVAIANIHLDYDTKFNNELTASTTVKELNVDNLDLKSLESSEVEHTSNFALNQGAKMMVANGKLIAKMKHCEKLTATEFGDEREQVVVMLQRNGTTRDGTQYDWPETVTGRSSIATTTSNIFEHFDSVTSTDQLFTDLTNTTNTSITTRYLHLPNFKTILPAFGVTQIIIPIAETSRASMNFCSGYKERISKDFDEIKIKIMHESSSVDDLEQQLLRAKHKQFHEHVQTMDADEYFNYNEVDQQFEEIFHFYRLVRDSCADEASISMRPQHNWPRIGSSSEAKTLAPSLIASNQSMDQLPSTTYLASNESLQRTYTKEQTIMTTTLIRLTDESVVQDANTIHEIPIHCIPQTRDERMVHIKRYPSFIDSGITSSKKKFTDKQEPTTTLHPIETSSLLSFDSIDQRGMDTHPYKNTKVVNESQEGRKIYQQTVSHLQNASLDVTQWEGSALEGNDNMYQTSVKRNKKVVYCKEHKERQQKDEAMNILEWHPFEKCQEWHYSSYSMKNHEWQKSNTSRSMEEIMKYESNSERNIYETQEIAARSKVKEDEMTRGLHSGVSETRIAMLQAGFELDTTLLATPYGSFMKDHSMTTSEYFSDEQQGWSTITEEYQRQQRKRNEQISRSLEDVRKVSWEDNVSTTIDEINHISDATTYKCGGCQKATTDTEMHTNLLRHQETIFETTNTDETVIKERTKNVYVPAVCEFNVFIGKSEQYETSSFTYLTRYQEPIKLKQEKCIESETLVANKEDEAKLRMQKLIEKRELLEISRESVERQVQEPIRTPAVQASLRSYEQRISEKITDKRLETSKPILKASSNALNEFQSNLEIRKNLAKEKNYIESVLSDDKVTAVEMNSFQREICEREGLKYVESYTTKSSNRSFEAKNFQEADKSFRASADEQSGTVTTFDVSTDTKVEQKGLTGMKTIIRTAEAGYVESSSFLTKLETISDRAAAFSLGESESVAEISKEVKERVRDTTQPSMQNIADNLGLKISLDTRFAEIDVKEEIVFNESMNQKVLQGSPGQIQSNLVAPVEISVKRQSVLEKFEENILETSIIIAIVITEQASAKYPESGFVEEFLTIEWSKVLSVASAEELIPVKETQKIQLSVEAAAEQEISYFQKIEKLKQLEGFKVKRLLEEAAKSEKQWIIASEAQEQTLFKEPATEASSTIVRDMEMIHAHIEYDTVEVTTSALFMKLEEKEVKEEVEVKVNISLKFEDHLNIDFAASESLALDTLLMNKRITGFQEECSIAQKSLEILVSNPKANCEKVEVVFPTFEAQSNEWNFINKSLDIVCLRIPKCGDEKQYFMSLMDVQQNAMSTKEQVAFTDTINESCSADAIQGKNVEFLEHFKHPESSECVDKAILLKESEYKDSKWGITQTDIEATIVQRKEIAEVADIVDTATYFTRIQNDDKQNIEFLCKTGQQLKECLSVKATEESNEQLEKLLIKSEQMEQIKETLKVARNDKIGIKVAASSETNAICTSIFHQQQQHQSSVIVIKHAYQEQIISGKYMKQMEVTELMNAIWNTVVNDLDATIIIHESHQQCATLSTSEYQELFWDSEHTFCMQPLHENISVQLRTKRAVSGDKRQFRIESEARESTLRRNEDEALIESIQKTALHGDHITKSVNESSEVRLDAGVLLMRCASQKTTNTASHVINIALTLSQQLKTQHAKEITNETNVELSVQCPILETNDVRKVINNEAAYLMTESTKTSVLKQTMGLKKSVEAVDGTISILKGVHKETVGENLQESNSERFEILSQWTTVDRDLETELSLQRSLNVTNIFSAIATSEEEAEINELWTANECNLETCVNRKIVTLERCQRNFQIEHDVLNILMEKFEKKETCESVCNAKHFTSSCASMKESVVQKLNALISLHRISSTLPKQSASECTWRDHRFIKAVPLQVKYELAENDYVVVDILLERPVWREFMEETRAAANWAETLLFECEQASVEKLRLNVEIHEKQLIRQEVGINWPEDVKGEAIIIDLEAYLEDEAALYVQMASKHEVFADNIICIKIKNEYEPQVLNASATKEEILINQQQFEILPQTDNCTYVVISGNKGDCLSVVLRETQENFVTLGLQYIEDEQLFTVEGKFVEKRSGGKYHFVTKATKVEDRNSSVAMTKPTEMEKIRMNLTEKIIDFESMNVFASLSEAISIDVNQMQAHQEQTVSTLQFCSRMLEPVKGCFLETCENVENIYVQFKFKESMDGALIVWKVPIYGGELLLDTESIEETLLEFEMEFYKVELFEMATKTLQQAVTTIKPLLSTTQATVETVQVIADWKKETPVGKNQLLCRCANKGIDISVKVKETTDVKQISYFQFVREVEQSKLEKVVAEIRSGGRLYFNFSATEENELNVVRELVSAYLQIAHCSLLLATENWSRGTSYKSIATSSESVDVPVILKNLEKACSVSGIGREKTVLNAELTVQESEAVALTINLSYCKETPKKVSEWTIWLANDGGFCILKTNAATEEQKLVKCVLEKKNDILLAVSKSIMIVPVEKIASLNTMQSEFVEFATYSSLKREPEIFEVCKILIAANHGDKMSWNLSETFERHEFTHFNFKQSDVVQCIDKIVAQAVYGGHLNMTTSATEECSAEVMLQLASKQITNAKTCFLSKIPNKSDPLILSMKAVLLEECTQVEILERKVEMKATTLTWQVTTAESVQFCATEITSEMINIAAYYRKEEENEEVEKTLFLVLFGGRQVLKTAAANEIVSRVNAEFVSRFLKFADACIQQEIANTTAPCELSTRFSIFEKSNQEHHFHKRRICECETLLVIHVANFESVEFRTTESTILTESITVQWQRNGVREETRLCFSDRRFGGALFLSTFSAQESDISITVTLLAPLLNLESVAFTQHIAFTLTEKPILITACTTEVSSEFDYDLFRTSSNSWSDAIFSTANYDAIVVQLIESTTNFETISIHYVKQQATSDVSALLSEARFGGSLILHALASTETFTSDQFWLSSQRLEHLMTEIIREEKNREFKQYRAIATTEQNVTSNNHLEKANQFFSVTMKKRAPHKGQNMYITFAESSEIHEFNNFILRSVSERNAGKMILLKEALFGGHLKASIKHATEQTVTIINNLRRSSDIQFCTISKEIINRGETAIFSCSASQEKEMFINLALQFKKLDCLEASVTHKASNRELSQQLDTNEFSEIVLSSNVAIQKSLGYESTQFVRREKRHGGKMMMQCVASQETYAELYNCLESRLPLKQHAGATLLIWEARRGEHIAMKLMATEETIFNAEVSFTKQRMETKNVHTEHKLNMELTKVLENVENLETVLEVQEKEVWRHLNEVHVESFLELAARERSPISFQTDSAEQTVSGYDAESCADMIRTSGMVEIEKMTDTVELLRKQSTDVTMRRENEEYDGMREEKAEKRVSFAAEVTEKTMSMDMSMTVERRETPSIVKKPMKKEQKSRRNILRQNEAPNFVPVRRNSLLLAMNLGSAHNIPHYKTLEDVITGIKKAGLEYSNLIFGIDYTKSNKYQGERTYDGRNLHSLSSDELNPYQQVIEIVGKTLSSFDADGVIPAYGFGDEESTDKSVFNLYDKSDINAECNGFEEVLRIYNEKTPRIKMSGPTNFVPLIEQAIAIVRDKQSYHILVIVADGQVTNEKINQKAIAAASHYPLSIIMVGVGDGPWNMMTRFDETLPKRMFDNFHFVDFHKVMFNAPNQEASFALNALMEIPDQYKAIKELGLLKHSRRG